MRGNNIANKGVLVVAPLSEECANLLNGLILGLWNLEVCEQPEESQKGGEDDEYIWANYHQ